MRDAEEALRLPSRDAVERPSAYLEKGAMLSSDGRNAQSWPERERRVMRSIEDRDVDLADLIGLVATTAPDKAEAAGHRARLDGYLALMAADTATRNTEAANKVANGIRWATWALVLVTVALIVVTALG